LLGYLAWIVDWTISCLSAAMEEPEPGQSVLGDVMQQMMDKLTDNEMLQLRTALMAFADEKGVVRISSGSICTGSGVGPLTLELLAKKLEKRMGISVKVTHEFMCELNSNKRKWLLKQFSPRRLYGDATHLKRPGGAWDFVAGKAVPVPPVHILEGGTSCKDFSKQNNNRSNFLRCVEEGTSTSGSTMSGP